MEEEKVTPKSDLDPSASSSSSSSEATAMKQHQLVVRQLQLLALEKSEIPKQTQPRKGQTIKNKKHQQTNTNKTLMAASIKAIGSDRIKPLRHINVIGQLNHATSGGFLYTLNVSIMFVILALLFLHSSTLQVSTVSGAINWNSMASHLKPNFWPLNVGRNEDPTTTIKSRVARSNASHPMSMDPATSMQAAMTQRAQLMQQAAISQQQIPTSKQFHYFWNHDQIEPKLMEREAGKVLAEAQASSDRDSLISTNGGGGFQVGARRSEVAESTASSSPSQQIVIPESVQQQLTGLVLNLQRQHQASLMMQPQLEAQRRLMSMTASHMNPMSRIWMAASSQHPVIAPPPFHEPSQSSMFATDSLQSSVTTGPINPINPFQSTSENLATRQQVPMASVAGVPVFGPFMIQPSIRANQLQPLVPTVPSVAAAAAAPQTNQIKTIQPVARASRSSQAASRLAASLLNRRKSWPILNLGQALVSAGTQIQPSFVIAPPPPPHQQTQQLTPHSPSYLDLLEHQFQLQARAQQQAFAAAATLAAGFFNQQQQKQVNQQPDFQTEASTRMVGFADQSPNGDMSSSASGIRHSRGNRSKQALTLQAPYLMSSLFASPATWAFNPSSASGQPSEASQNFDLIETYNGTAVPFGSRLRRRELISPLNKQPRPPYANQMITRYESDSDDKRRKRESAQIEQNLLKLIALLEAETAAAASEQELKVQSRRKRAKRSAALDPVSWIASSPESRSSVTSTKSRDISKWSAMEDIKPTPTELLRRQSGPENGAPLKVKRLTANASFMHHQSTKLTGQRSSKPRESVTTESDPMNASLAESARVNYFQNIENEVEIKEKRQESSKERTGSSGNDIQINVGFPSPVKAGHTGSKNETHPDSPKSAFHVRQNAGNLGPPLPAGSAGGGANMSLASSNIMSHQKVRMPATIQSNQSSNHGASRLQHQASVNSVDISSAATGNLAFVNNANFGSTASSPSKLQPIKSPQLPLNGNQQTQQQLTSSSNQRPMTSIAPGNLSGPQAAAFIGSLLGLGQINPNQRSSTNIPVFGATNMQRQSISMPGTPQSGSEEQAMNMGDPQTAGPATGGYLQSELQEMANQQSVNQQTDGSAGTIQQNSYPPQGSIEQPMIENNQNAPADTNQFAGVPENPNFGVRNLGNPQLDASNSLDQNSLDLSRFNQMQQQQQQPQQQSSTQQLLNSALINQNDQIQPMPEQSQEQAMGNFNQEQLPPMMQQPQSMEEATQTLLAAAANQNQLNHNQHQYYTNAVPLQNQPIGAAVSIYNQNRLNQQIDDMIAMRGLNQRTKAMYSRNYETLAIPREGANLMQAQSNMYPVDEEAAAGVAAATGIPTYPTAAQMMAIQKHAGLRVSDLNGMLMAGSENLESGEDSEGSGKSKRNKNGKKNFKHVSHHYHFGNLQNTGSPLEDPEAFGNPMGQVDLAGAIASGNDPFKKHKAKENKDEDEEDKPKKKGFLKRLNLRRFFQKFKKEKKPSNDVEYEHENKDKNEYDN